MSAGVEEGSFSGFRFQFTSLRKNHSLSLFADNQLSLNCPLKNPTFFLVFILPFFCILSQIIVLISIQLSALETQGSSLTVFPLALCYFFFQNQMISPLSSSPGYHSEIQICLCQSFLETFSISLPVTELSPIC